MIPKATLQSQGYFMSEVLPQYIAWGNVDRDFRLWEDGSSAIALVRGGENEKQKIEAAAKPRKKMRSQQQKPAVGMSVSNCRLGSQLIRGGSIVNMSSNE